MALWWLTAENKPLQSPIISEGSFKIAKYKVFFSELEISYYNGFNLVLFGLFSFKWKTINDTFLKCGFQTEMGHFG